MTDTPTDPLPRMIPARANIYFGGDTLPTSHVIDTEKCHPVRLMVAAGIGDHLIPNDPSQTIAAALGLVLVAEMERRGGFYVTRTYVDRDQLIAVFGSTHPGEVARRFASHQADADLSDREPVTA